jgi:hypothetical protein
VNTLDTSANPVSLKVFLPDQKLFVVQFRTGKKLPSFTGLPFGSAKNFGTAPEKPGVQFLQPTKKTDVDPLLCTAVKQLHLVNAFIVFLPDEACQMVQFTFAKTDREIGQAFRDSRWRYLKALENISHRSYWRVRGFINPLTEGGDMMVLNCHMPVHRHHGNGEPVMAWKKDADGKRVGEKAVPITADYSLEISGDSTVRMTPAQKE